MPPCDHKIDKKIIQFVQRSSSSFELFSGVVKQGFPPLHDYHNLSNM